jgi:hypothetical protein
MSNPSDRPADQAERVRRALAKFYARHPDAKSALIAGITPRPSAFPKPRHRKP